MVELGDGWRIRPIDASDSFEALTELLHRAYAQLGAMGLGYQAVTQSVEKTRARAAEGCCYVVLQDGTLVGTATLMGPEFRGYCDHYSRPDVAYFGQLAVEPTLQRRGLGSRVVRHLESVAQSLGASELACDTSESAEHLVRWYEGLGYRVVARETWDFANYQSVILSKPLGPQE